MGLINFIGQAQEIAVQASGNQTVQDRQQQVPTKANRPVPTSKNRKSKPKPEKLKFLKPCPICAGREFTHGKKGGFFCNFCQPGIDGHRVVALGYRKPRGSEKKLIRVEQRHGKAAIKSNRREGPEKHLQAAFPWIMEHLPELLEAGWTRPELFRRGTRKWPVGNWGVAWGTAWKKENLVVTVGHKGELIFTFTSGGRESVQRCFPDRG